jgi:hypothetical protein
MHLSFNLQINEYETMLENWSPRASNMSNYDDLQLESLRARAASCKVEEKELLEELLKVKQDELRCFEVEEAHSTSIMEFDKLRCERRDKIQRYIQSCLHIADTVGNEHESVFAVEVYIYKYKYKHMALLNILPPPPPPCLLSIK